MEKINYLKDIYNLCKKYPKLHFAIEYNEMLYGIQREGSHIADEIWFEKIKLIPFDMKNNFYQESLIYNFDCELENETCWRENLHISPFDKLGNCKFEFVFDDKVWERTINNDNWESPNDYDISWELKNYMIIIKVKKYRKFVELQFEKPLYKILNIYTEKEWINEPLDSDEVDILIEHLRNQLNLINGNITNEEYNYLEEK